jgi:hypothetical protein
MGELMAHDSSSVPGLESPVAGRVLTVPPSRDQAERGADTSQKLAELVCEHAIRGDDAARLRTGCIVGSDLRRGRRALTKPPPRLATQR